MRQQLERYYGQSYAQVQDLVLRWVLIPILLTCSAVTVSWVVGNRLNTVLGKPSTALLIALLVTLSFVGGAIAYWTTLLQIAALNKSREQLQRTHDELERRVEARTTELAKLAALTTDVSRVLTKSDNLQAILQQCTETLVQHLDVAFARTWLLNEAENVLELFASAGLYTHLDGPHSRVAMGQLKIGRIAQNRQPHLTNTVIGDPNVSDQEWAAQTGMVAFAGYPLLVEDAVVGVMAMFAQQPLTEFTLNRLSTIATSIAQCIQRKKIEAALEESQGRLTALIDSLPGIAFFCSNTPGYPMTYVSEGCLALTGYTSEELVGEHGAYNAITHPDDLPKVLNAIKTGIALQQPYVVEYRIRAKSGEEKWLWEKGNIVWHGNDRIIGVKGFVTDLTQRKCMEEDLRQAKEKYRSIFENAVEGIFQTDPRGFYISANPTLAKIYGYKSSQELIVNLTNIGQQLYVDSDRRTEFVHQMQKYDAVSNFESQVHRRDGSVIWISENARAVRDHNGILLYYEGSVEDITERKVAEEKLLHNAFHDSLTDLANRALFMDRLGQALHRTKQHREERFAVLFLDLDRFKVINDSLGHLMGDQFLIAIASRLAACLHSTDTVARLGGDEFTILMEGLKDLSDVFHLADCIQEALALPFELNGQEVFTTVSIGIALSTTNFERPEDILRAADTAMYRAKALGRARYEIFNPDMYTQAVARLQLETDLRHALDRQEFQVYYQPIVAFASGRIAGFEALIRWQHPDRGLVTPTDFIPVAEETGQIVPIGYWVLRRACHEMQAWLERNSIPSPLKISVNLSLKQFSQPDLTQQIQQILHETGLHASSLVLEITESVIMENDTSATSALSQLQALGIQLSIDDFGTGYSSLARLHHFPISGLKIDRSFVSSPDALLGNSEIVETIATLAQKLGISVTAEGVETQEQVALLRELNCEYGQGYLFSPPLNSQDAEALIWASPQW
ncbi:MAG: EAL domain-containing protein [Chroococcidiopsidaceae cyanobacterium CP_BM_RX_35]|nr:EAL domain-containing protein [Chroococcidiopsidaceae cyanobacterium CP_BM_RX_35]